MKPFGVVTKSGTFVHNNVLNQYATKAESRKLKDGFGGDYATEKLITPLYNPESLAKLMEMNTYHYRAVKTKARDTAGQGWELADVGDATTQEGEMEQAADALKIMLDALTPPLTIILDHAQTDYESVGWACIELIRENYAGDGPIVDIEHIPAHTIRLHKDGLRYLQKRGVKKRWFKAIDAQVDVDADTGDVKPLGALAPERRATELMMWVNYTPRSDYYGLPDILPALGALQGDIARRDYNIAFFDNFGVPAYAVFITGDFEAGDATEDANGVERTPLEAAIEEHFQELAKNPHSTLILTIPGTDVKVDFQPLAMEVKEASFRMYRMDNRDEILAAHGVPPYRAGIAETGSLGGSTAEESTEIYKRSVIEPRQSLIEHYFNRYIVRGAFGVTTKEFRLSRLDTSDEQHDMSMLQNLFAMGAVSVQEVRAIWAKRFNLSDDVPVADIPDDAPLEVLESAVQSMYDRVIKGREQREQHPRMVQRRMPLGSGATGTEGE